MTSGTRLAAVLLLLAGCAKKDTSSALHAGDLLVQLRLDPDPPRAADNVLHVELVDAQGKPVDGARHQLHADIPAIARTADL